MPQSFKKLSSADVYVGGERVTAEPICRHIYRRERFKTLSQELKLLIMNNFTICHDVFNCYFNNLTCIFHMFGLLLLKLSAVILLYMGKDLGLSCIQAISNTSFIIRIIRSFSQVSATQSWSADTDQIVQMSRAFSIKLITGLQVGFCMSITNSS